MEAALAGDIQALYAVIREDPFILESIDKIPFADTPLHVAASNGHTEFAKEIITVQPSFARKLNCEGFSPMHLALRNEKIETVVCLLHVDAELIRVKGKEGKTPLHYVVGTGNLDLLARFLSVCPESLEDVTTQSETALHIAVKNKNIEAFRLLFAALQCLCLREEYQHLIKRVLNWKDKDGNTLLHLATFSNQPEVVKCLICCKVDVNVQNSKGLTARDIAIKHETSAEALGAGYSLPSIIDTATKHFLSLRADQRLNDVAQSGNVDDLYALLREDAHLLDRIDQVPFVNTPLHIAAAAGHTRFALEVMRLKPSFARKQNPDGFCPTHLALQYKQTELFHGLLDVDRNLARVRGRDGKTSLHYAAEKEDAQLLYKILTACPESIVDVTTRKENALHLAVKNERLETLEVLLKWIKYVDKAEILNWTDDEGNTLLHIAVSRSDSQMAVQMARLLIKKVKLNAKNSVGSTALDILEDHGQKERVLQKLLLKAGALRGSSLQNKVNIVEKLKKKKVSLFEKMVALYYRRKLGITNESRNAVLVVAVLIATATYQAALSPSEVVEPKYKQPDNDKSNIESPTFAHVGAPYGSPSFENTTSFENVTSIRAEPEYAISYYNWFPSITEEVAAEVFLYANIAVFYISMLEIHRHLPRGTAISLVYPLVFCFLLLMAARSQVSLYFSLVLMLLPLSFSLVPARIIMRIKRHDWLVEVLRHVFKHYRSFHNEMVTSDHGHDIQRYA